MIMSKLARTHLLPPAAVVLEPIALAPDERWVIGDLQLPGLARREHFGLFKEVLGRLLCQG